MNPGHLNWTRIFILITASWHHSALAVRNNGFYQDPFDTGAGGSVLTWATQESMLMNNPALLPHGGKFIRWIGSKFNIMPGADSVGLARQLANGQNTEGSGGNSLTESVNQLFTNPVHLGLSTATSFITSRGGFTLFASTEPDIKAWKRGDPEQGAGTPNIILRSETYGGAYASVASLSFWDWMSFGISAKYIVANEIEERIEITSQDEIQSLQNDQERLTNITSASAGAGMDAGFLLFFQGSHLDLRLAGTVANAGGLSLTGEKSIRVPQMLNAGAGLTLHTTMDAIHLSVDYRDISNEMKEAMYRRIYAGVRITFRTYLGFSAGYHHGSPTYGAELDLILFRVAGAVYTREYAHTPGLDRRKIFIASLSIGNDF